MSLRLSPRFTGPASIVQKPFRWLLRGESSPALPDTILNHVTVAIKGGGDSGDAADYATTTGTSSSKAAPGEKLPPTHDCVGDGGDTDQPGDTPAGQAATRSPAQPRQHR